MDKQKDYLDLLTPFNIIIVSSIIIIFYYVVITQFKEIATAFSDIFFIFANLTVSLCLFYAAFSSRKYGRALYLSWLVLAIGQFSYFMGDVLWSYIEVVLQQQAYPAISDIFYLAYYPIFALGLFMMSKTKTSLLRSYKNILDIIIITVSTGIFLWAFLVAPIFESGTTNLIVTITSVAYVALDFVLIFALIYLTTNKKTINTPEMLLITGISFMIISDVAYAFFSVMGTYTTGTIINVGWLIFFILVALAGLYHAKYLKKPVKPLIELSDKSEWTTYSPLIGVIIAYILIIWGYLHYNVSFIRMLIFGSIILSLIAIRSIISSRENSLLFKNVQNELILRKKADESFKESERKLSTLMNNLSGMAYRCKNDPKWTMIFVSDGASKLTGYEPEDILFNSKITYGELIHPDDQKKVWDEIQFALKEKRQFTLIYRIKTSTNVEKWVWEKGIGVFDSNGELIFLEGFITDITSRKLSEENLKESKEKYRTIIDTAGEAILLYDTRGTVLEINQRALELFAFKKEEIIGKPLIKLLPKLKINKKEALMAFKDVMMGKQISKTEWTFTNKNDEEKVVVAHYTRLKKDKKTIGLTLLLEDITERKKAENEIIRSLEEKEVLLKEIHHRVKNSLQIIDSLLSLQSAQIETPNDLELFRESRNRVKVLSHLYETLYNSKDLVNLYIPEYIGKIIYNLTSTYNISSDKIEIQTEISNISLSIETSMPMGIIITEIISNSIKYSFPGDLKGKITIKLEKENEKFILTITDNGVGLGKDFDVENTDTLGLKLVYLLAEQLDAHIELDTTYGNTFKIIFKELKYQSRL